MCINFFVKKHTGQGEFEEIMELERKEKKFWMRIW